MLLRVCLYLFVFFVGIIVSLRTNSPKVRTAVLLVGSYIVYLSWVWWFAAILFGSTLMNHLLGRWVRQKKSRSALALGTLMNVALLSCFKYLPQTVSHLPFSSLQRISSLALPLGISFWTFQAIGYLFDCFYRGEELDPTFPEFALYMAFFPIVISGPICRMPQMLPQFRSSVLNRWNNVQAGFCRIATGALMMQLAKLLGQGILAGDGINSGFDRLTAWSGPDVWCLAFGYGLQLFFDFAGYSHIAIGAARALGFTVPENFDRPFRSATPSVFWTRWHMSLSFWIRDYVFLPIAMLRRGAFWQNLTLLLSMILFGLWHKASALFVLWGCYHGLLLILHRQIQELEFRLDWNPPERLWSVLSWISTISLVSLGWIFFRASSLAQARQMWLAVLSPGSYGSHFLSGSLYLLVAALAAAYALVVLVDRALDQYSGEEREEASVNGVAGFFARSRWIWLPPLYALVLLFVSLITMNTASSAAQLMYRRF